MSSTTPLLEVRDLARHFAVREGVLQRVTRLVRAVDGVSFTLAAGRTLGLVGESGCGKSTLGRTILQLHPPTRGSVLLDGVDLTRLDRAALLERRRDMQIVFQDPYGSLNPRRTVGQSIREPLDVHRIGDRAARRQRVRELLETVGLSPDMMERYPHEFSGGQRQRIGIARALALSPRFVVADEPVSALDVSVQSQILNLLAQLQQQHGLSFLFVSHDLAVIQHISHEVAVMYLGRIVEHAAVGALFRNPLHPYTRALMSAVPVPDPAAARRRRIVLTGEMPSAASPPPGCAFHTRCPEAMRVCREETPPAIRRGTAAEPHMVRCHLYS